jgi:starvation-inducible DNA-binding protein
MSKNAEKLIRTHLTLPAEVREEMARVLNTLLASASDLYSHAKQAHWNVRGPDFIGVHELFDKVAQEASAHADLLAERAGQLGAGVHGTIRQAAKTSQLPEYPLGIAPSAEHIEQLSSSLALFGKQLLSAIEKGDEADDPVTVDILTEICRATDQTLWFVESHATPKPSELGVKRAS